MSKKFRVLALLSILPVTLTACTIRDIPFLGRFFPEEAPPVVEISVWGLWERKDIMQISVNKFQEVTPNIIANYDDRSALDLVEYKERVFERAKDPTGPDVILVHNTWVPRMIASGLLDQVPASTMDSSTYASTFYPVAAQTGMSNGVPYAMPAYYDGLVLVYNKAHFAEIEQASPPTAWEEFRRLALQLSVRDAQGNLVRGGAGIGAANNVDHATDILGLMWSQAGVDIPEEIDSKAAQDALTFYTNFVVEDEIWSEAMPESTKAFVDDRVSMIFVPSWQILSILENIDDVSKVGVAPVPQAVPSRPATWASYWVYVVPKDRDASKKTAAWTFVKYMTGEEASRALFNENTKIRQFGTPFALVSLGSELAADPYLSPVVNGAPTAKSGEIASKSGNRRQEEALKNAITRVLNGDDAGIAVILNEAKIEVAK